MADRSSPAGRLIATATAVMLLAFTAAGAWTARPDETADPVLEARAREIGKELRCLVCQNQSIDDSEADLARDLRVLVRERLRAGDSDRQVVDYVVSRYGDFVLLRPPLKPATYALWFGPALILSCAVVAMIFYYRQSARQDARAEAPLNRADEERLARVQDGRGRVISLAAAAVVTTVVTLGLLLLPLVRRRGRAAGTRAHFDLRVYRTSSARSIAMPGAACSVAKRRKQPAPKSSGACSPQRRH